MTTASDRLPEHLHLCYRHHCAGMFLTVMAAYALSRKDFIWANPLMLIISFTMLFSGGIVTLYILVTQTLNM